MPMAKPVVPAKYGHPTAMTHSRSGCARRCSRKASSGGAQALAVYIYRNAKC